MALRFSGHGKDGGGVETYLTDERIAALDIIGFEWEGTNEGKEYKGLDVPDLALGIEKSSNVAVAPSSSAGNLPNRRQTTSSSISSHPPSSQPPSTPFSLPPSIFPILNSISSSSPHGATWATNYRSLLLYRSAHGDTKVPHLYPPNPSLGHWVAGQRRQLVLMLRGERSSMNEDRRQCLDAVGFWWGKMEEEGALPPPSENSSRRNDGTTASTASTWTPPPPPQRISIDGEKIKNILIDLRREAEREEAHGALRGYHAAWMEQFRRLQNFVHQHGHAKVPHIYNKDMSLGYWVSGQRKAMANRLEGKKSSLTSKRIEALEAVGFWWGLKVASHVVKSAMSRGDGMGTMLTRVRKSKGGKSFVECMAGRMATSLVKGSKASSSCDSTVKELNMAAEEHWKQVVANMFGLESNLGLGGYVIERHDLLNQQRALVLHSLGRGLKKEEKEEKNIEKENKNYDQEEGWGRDKVYCI